MKKISRKGFLKVAAAAAMSGVTASALAACNAGSSSSTAASTGEAIYTPGTYTGTATGIGEVKVTMTFSETAITEVVIDASNETESIGGVAAPTLQDAIMAAVLPLPLVPATCTNLSCLCGSPSAASRVRVRVRPGLWPAHWTAWMYSIACS